MSGKDRVVCHLSLLVFDPCLVSCRVRLVRDFYLTCRVGGFWIGLVFFFFVLGWVFSGCISFMSKNHDLWVIAGRKLHSMLTHWIGRIGSGQIGSGWIDRCLLILSTWEPFLSYPIHVWDSLHPPGQQGSSLGDATGCTTAPPIRDAWW